MPSPGANPMRGVGWVAALLIGWAAVVVGAWLVWWLGGWVCEELDELCSF